MTLILETGAGLTDSNSYADVETADAFHADRDNAAWSAASDTAKASALIRATDYIDANYIFRSVTLTADQALQNPRYADEKLAPALVKATIMLASDLLTIDPNKPLDERDVIAKTTGVGSGAVTTSKTFDKRNTDRFEHITKVLKSIASPRSSSASTMWLTR